jgi:hypothetical protein
MNSGGCFPQLAFIERGNPQLAAVLAVAFEDKGVQLRLLGTRPARELQVAWSALEVCASSRELWGRHAGRHRGRLLVRTHEGWLAIPMLAGDDERMARGLLRALIDCVDQPRALLERRLHDIDARYRVELLDVRDEHDRAATTFDALSRESQLEALLTMRLHVIDTLELDDVEADTTVLEHLHARARASSGHEREQLRHACELELAIGQFLAAESLGDPQAPTRAACMREAFDRACKAFSEFAEIAAERRTTALEVRLCFVDA